MTLKALLFGSIGTLVETSEMQRQAFNAAFREADLDWNWGPEAYREMLTRSGGKQRIEEYARLQKVDVDAALLHQRKTAIFDEMMLSDTLPLRKGVAETIGYAKERGLKLGFVTTTSRDNIDAMFKAVGDALDRDVFDFIGDASLVRQSKPSGDIYDFALSDLGIAASEALAIEDTPVSLRAAAAVGIRSIGFAGAFSTGTFEGASFVTDALSPQLLMDEGQAGTSAA